MCTRIYKVFIFVLSITLFGIINCQTAFAQVTANFSATITSGCSPVVTQFTDLSTTATPGGIISWKWTFGNGGSATQKNPSRVYVNPGIYDVCLIVRDSISSDTLCMQDYITVFADPIPAISADTTRGCSPYTVNFTDQSIPGSAGIKEVVYDFGDGSPFGLIPNPSHLYEKIGMHSVTLSVKDSNNCQDNKTFVNFIEVGGMPEADFSADNNSSCVPPLTVNFTDSSSSLVPLTYLWDFGNADTSHQQNPTVTYTGLGTYDVQLIVRNSTGCSDTLLLDDFIAVQDLVADFTADRTQGCLSTPVQFTDLSTSNPDSLLWNFGDGTFSSDPNPSHTYTATGTYTVTLIASNSSSCSDTIVKPNYITIVQDPVANFSVDVQESCSAPLTVNFTDLSINAVGWIWDFGDGDTSHQQHPAHTYTSIDSFDVTLTVISADSCEASIMRTDYIRIAPPQAMIFSTRRNGCLPLTINFADSTQSLEPVVSWLWNFGDGFTSAQQHPTHVYSDTGSFTVSLIIENAAGCIDTLIDSNYIHTGVRPTANFTANPLIACIYNPVNFINTTLNSNTWHWDFGDGGFSDQYSPTHTYSDTGYFTITLIARDNGCADTLELEDYIYVSPPDAVFSSDPNCANPFEYIFTDASLAPDTWLWDFGDGSTSNTPEPTHTYASRGSYTVTLTVTNTTTGCLDVEQLSLNVTVPEAGFITDTTIGCHPLVVTFSDTSTDAVSWRWETGGMVKTSQNPAFTYEEPGSYDVRLIVTDVNGCTDTILKPDHITVLGPTAEFSGAPFTGCKPLGVIFSDSSSSFMAPIVSWDWDFGNGDSSALQNPTSDYYTAGLYTVSLIVSDSNGCAHTETKIDYIKPTQPVADFTVDNNSCTTHSLQFINNSVGQGMTFLWNFGDSTTSTSVNPTHTYTQEGIYTVSLTTTDQNGCDSILVKQDYIIVSDPVAGIDADTTFSPCPPLFVNFIDSSINDVAEWEWDFGDNSTSELQNPSHIYNAPGSYDVTLTVTSSLGCTSTLFLPDYINVEGPNGTFEFIPKNQCVDEEVQFNASTFNTNNRTWDFGDGIVGPGGDTITHIYSGIGCFNPVLILDDGMGCIYAVSSTDSVCIGDIAANFTVSDNLPCVHESITFTDISVYSPTITSWHWDFGNGDTSNLQNPTVNFDTSGYFDITLIVSNGICYDTMVKTDYIYVDPFPQAAFNLNVSAGCVPVDVEFQNMTQSDTLISTYSWNFGDGENDTTANPTHTYANTGTYTIELVVTTEKGCTDTASSSVLVNPLPAGDAGPDTSLCKGTTIQLSGSGPLDYSWFPATGLDNANIAKPNASPDTTTTYILTVIDSNGCESADTMVLEVYPVPVAAASEDEEICIGNSIELWATGGVSYIWTPGVSLNCNSCSNPIATPDTTTTYIVRALNNYKCFDSDTVTITVHERPIGITSADTTMCAGDSYSLSSEGGITNLWYPVTALSCSDCPNPVASPPVTTTYTLLSYNEFNCETYDSVTVTINPIPDIRIQSENICEGDTRQIFTSGGTVYNWTPSTGLSCDDCPHPFANPSDTITYQLEVINSFACVNYDSVTIAVVPRPQVHTIDNITICNGDDVELTTTFKNTASFNWSPVVGLSDSTAESPMAMPTATTKYVISANGMADCLTKDSVTITVIDQVDVTAVEDIEICKGESAELSAEVLSEGNYGTNVIWFPVNFLNNPTSLSQTFTPERSITYNLIAYSGSCEPDTESVNIIVHQLPFVDAGPVQNVLEEQEIELTPLTGDSIAEYAWSPSFDMSCSSCENPTTLVMRSGTYTVTVTDIYGCESSDSVRVIVTGKCGDDIFVPNIFTPNGDEVNDELLIRSQTIAELNYFKIFDRWGNIVFNTNDQSQGWNGVFHGQRLTPSVFVYGLDATCINGKSVRRQGNITLVR